MTQQRIPRARNALEVTRGFLACREAGVTSVALVGVWLAAALWGSAHGGSVLLVLAGFSLWYVIEIPIHRWILHMQVREGTWQARLWKRLHYRHHQQPTDPAYLFLPEWVALPAIGIIAGGAWLLGYPAEGLWFLAGFWSALTSYEWMHYAVHSRWQPAWGPLRRTFEAHRNHHFHNEGYWFGVSNSFMDRFWRTGPSPESVPKSATTRDIGPD